MSVNNKAQRGFTLIELMITVAVIAVLAAIAVPSYREYVLRSHRVEGQGLLSEAAARQERWRAQNGGYSTPATANPSTLAKAVDNLKLPGGEYSENRYYKLEIEDSTTGNGGYLLIAKRNGAQANDSKCGDFTLTATGTKGMASGGDVATCWR